MSRFYQIFKEQLSNQIDVKMSIFTVDFERNNYLYLNNFMSFNLTLYAPMTNDRNLWVQGKLVPRFEINPLGTSDLNYFEKLHNEIICPVVQEQLCEEIQPYFA